MASYHLSVKPVSRASGRSSIAAIAYRHAEKLHDERTGIEHDYTRKQGVQDSFIVAPEGADWAQDRAALWNAAEAAETRRNARVAREYEIALPAELNAKERRALAETFANGLVERYGVAVDVALHAPHRDGDQRNYHAHVMTTTRQISAWGLGDKTRVLDDQKTGPQEVEAVREMWGRQTNQALELANVPERVDHRSLKAQGVERDPTRHMGPGISAIERRAMKRAQAERRPYEPVTQMGLFNQLATQGRAALKKEVATLREYVRAGEKWLEKAFKPLKEKLNLGQAFAGLSEVAEKVRRQVHQQDVGVEKTSEQDKSQPEIEALDIKPRGPNMGR